MKTKKFLIILLTLAALAGLLTVLAGAAEWSGSGTETDPYRIGSAGDLLALAESVNGGKTHVEEHFELTVDLSVTDWTPIGSSESFPFGGTFDGGGHSIAVSIDTDADCQGLFGVITGTVKNLAVSASVTGGSSAGGIAARSYGKVENCSVSGTVTGSSCVGGVVGYMGQGAVTSDCTSSATVTGAGSAVGGIVGCANNISEHNGRLEAMGVTRSGGKSGTRGAADPAALPGEESASGLDFLLEEEEAPVSGRKGASAVRGAAQATRGDVVYAAGGTVSGCIFTGTLNGTTTAAPSDPEYHEDTGTLTIYYYENGYGGIVGWSNGSAVTDCENKGTVNGDDFAGGIVGDSTNGGTVTGCVNSGTVTGNGRLTGGIAGRMNQGTVADCINKGAVTGRDFTGGVTGFADKESSVTGCLNDKDASVTGGDYTGGVIGISNCVVTGQINTGSVSGAKYTGGVVGYTTRDVTSCTAGSTSSVTSDSGFTGGIAGYSIANVNNCTGAGTVKGSSWVGGVAGYVKKSVDVCSGSAGVTGGSYVGGIVGQADGPVLDCTKTGSEVKGSLAFTGGIAGKASSDISGCVNSGAVTGPSLVTGGVAGTVMGRADNCENSGTVSGPGGLTGGVAGIVAIGAEMTDCSNSGMVSGGAYTGGVAGLAAGPVSGCTNSGAVTGSDVYTGGIAGTNSKLLENCSNSGPVSGVRRTGGIVGSCLIGGTVYSCTNTATVTGSSDWTGGIAGSTGGVKATDGADNTVNENGTGGVLNGCVNKAGVNGKDGTGGVVGMNTGLVTNCSNTGTVSGGGMTGGVAGYSVASGSVLSSSNGGNVSGADFTGGVVGTNDGPVDNCSNTGTVTAGGECAGGVSGASEGTLTNCTNKGTVNANGKSHVGGVVGTNLGTLSDCFNSGAVTGGSSYIGGIAGFNNKGTVASCVNEAGGTVSGSWQYIGGAVGYNNGSADNLRNRAAVSAGGAEGVGGVVGYSSGAIAKCENEGSVSGQRCVGGILGVSEGGCELSQSTNSGTVTGSGSTVGGIAGRLSCYYGNSSCSDCLNKKSGKVTAGGTDVGGIVGDTWRGAAVTRCENRADVTSTGSEDVGGIVGYSTGDIKDCVNSGNVSASNSAKDVAGIAGHHSNSSAVIKDCKNSGNISGGKEYIGGIAGYANQNKVTECENSGKVGDSTDRGTYVGGIVGISQSGEVTYCRNSGTVKGNNCVGGVVGRIDHYFSTGSAPRAYRCINTGTVSCGSNSDGYSEAGGVVGYASNDTRIDECCNRGGSVSGTGKAVGGVVGSIDNGSVVVDCYNWQTIKGAYCVGGVAGFMKAGSTMRHCYNWSGNDPYASGGGGEHGGKLIGGKNCKLENITLTHNVFTNERWWPAGWDDTNTMDGYHYFLNGTMKKQKEFTDIGWDFTDVWKIYMKNEDEGWPVLRFEGKEGANTDDPIDPGTPEIKDLYIYTLDDLKTFRDNVNSGNKYSGRTVYLCSDLDLGGENWTPIGTESNAFYGTFDGQGHRITGLSVTGDIKFAGFFGYNCGTVEFLGVWGEIRSTAAGSGSAAGGIAGSSPGSIEQCSFEGVVDTKSPLTGGIAGTAGGMIVNCRHAGPVTGPSQIGSGSAFAGGIAGVCGSNVMNCVHISGKISGQYAGGMIGMFFGFLPPTFKGYYLEGTADKAIGASDSSDPEEFRSLSASDIVKQSSFTDWNFSDVWGMGTDGPVLRIFSDPVTLIANYGNNLGGDFTTVWIPKTGGALPPCTFTNGSRRFAGWNTMGDGTGAPYADEGYVCGSLTLFAQWGDGLGTRYEYYDAGTSDAKLFDDDLTSTGTLKKGENLFYTKHYVKPSGFVIAGGDPAGGVSWTLEAKAFSEDEWTVLARGDSGALSSTGRTETAINDPTDGEYCYYRIVVSSAMDLSEFYLTVKDADKDVRLPLVFFHSHEGKGTMDSVPAENRSTIDLPKNQFTRDGYSFYGWNSRPDGSGIPYNDEGEFFVREDAILYAQWWRPYSYTIRFENEDGSYLDSVTVKAGQLPVYPGETPVKPESGGKTYIFAGWSPEIVTVTGNTTYKATYTEKIVKYKITFQNYDGTELESSDYAYGETPSYTGETPVRGEDAKYTYTFSGWTPEIVSVTGEATYTATYTPALRSYTVTWLQDDGTQIGTTTVEYGQTPAHSDPEKTADAKYTYSFAGWTPEIVSVTGEATYTATYTPALRSYTVTWLQDDGTQIDTSTVEYGQTPSHADPEKTADAKYTYTFAGWTPEIVSVTGEATYTATYTPALRSYTVTWLQDDGTLIGTDTVEYGQTPAHDDPAKEADAQYTYTFAGWSPEVVSVTGEAAYTATYTPKLRSYTVTWLQDDGTKIDTTMVTYGVIPAHDDPTKEADAQFTYTFAGWTPEIVSVTGEATYTATYDGALRSYTVTWLQDDGSVIGTDTLEYGQTPAHADPSKAADAENTYTFAGWTPEIVSVTGDAAYTATYTGAKNKYTITWLNEDGSVLGRTKVEYGQTPAHDGPDKKADAKYTYTFADWDPAPVPVTGNATYTATYMQTLRIYVIIWQQDDGTEIDRTKVEYGQMPVHADPAKESDADITYTFAGWSPEIKSVTGEATYRAAYTATGNVCTVTWLQDDGTEIDRTTVGYGQTPAHADPAKAADAKYTYTFTGWDPAITAATGDVTYRATYSAKVNEYTVTFRNEDGTVLQTVTVAYGETPEYTGKTPVKAADADRTYTFAGWDKKISAVTGETEYTATFRASEQTDPAPATGDRDTLVLPAAVMIVSGAAAAFVLKKRRAGAR